MEHVDLTGLKVRELGTLDRTPPPVDFNFGDITQPLNPTYSHTQDIAERAKHFWGASPTAGGPS